MHGMKLSHHTEYCYNRLRNQLSKYASSNDLVHPEYQLTSRLNFCLSFDM